MMVLLRKEYSFSGGDTQTLLAPKRILSFMHPQVVRMQKLQVLAHMPGYSSTDYEPPGQTFTT